MKRRMTMTVMLALAIAAAFAIGFWCGYMALFIDLMFKLIEALNKVFVS
jgi:hypothetical protein